MYTPLQAVAALIVVALLIYLYDSFAYRFYIKESDGLLPFCKYRSILIRQGHWVKGSFKRQCIQWLTNPMDAKMERHYRRYYVVATFFKDAGSKGRTKDLRYYVDFVDDKGQVVTKEIATSHWFMTDMQCNGISLSKSAEFYLTFAER